ncbi:hypothetical protein J0A68_19125 [Algoriphagus sp. H41]|uniref:Hpt domain-containing protein n=1 Tax=Algoriphagus oliviformis TaxID=2811231 RepID=A0ABS3C8B6_9BACT|nr:hypothetical protein [Algoriphagus oliviformis]MBN7813075.1 hypothetical protein [Algoriphagus oliviformis]
MEPTFSYLDNLSGENREFKMRIIKIILTELPKELELYHFALSLKNHFWASEIVHRINQKISFLQMNEAVNLVDIHEVQLRAGSTTYVDAFNEIVNTILEFLENSQK